MVELVLAQVVTLAGVLALFVGLATGVDVTTMVSPSTTAVVTASELADWLRVLALVPDAPMFLSACLLLFQGA
jgi:hypothetical protein